MPHLLQKLGARSTGLGDWSKRLFKRRELSKPSETPHCVPERKPYTNPASSPSDNVSFRDSATASVVIAPLVDALVPPPDPPPSSTTHTSPDTSVVSCETVAPPDGHATPDQSLGIQVAMSISTSPMRDHDTPHDPVPSSSSSSDPVSQEGSPSGETDLALGDLWHEALCLYRDTVGVDLGDETSGLSRELGQCSNYRAVVDALDKVARQFESYRHPSPESVGAKIRGALRHIVKAVLSAGVLEAVGEASAAGAVPLVGGKAIFVAIGILLRATKGVSDRFDAVLVLLKKFEYYMTRLDLRLSASIRQQSRELTVKIFIEMLGALALATEMMRQNRAQHFVRVLLGRGNDVIGISQKFEDLMNEDTRLSLEDTRLSLQEVHREMCTLSRSFLRVFDELGLTVARMDTRIEAIDDRTEAIDNRTEAIYTYLMVMSARFQAAGIYEMQRPITSVLEILEQWRAAYNSNNDRAQPASTEDSGEGAVSLRRTGMQVTFFVDSSSLEHLVDSMLACFRGLVPADHAVLRHILYSLAAVAVNVSVGKDMSNIWHAARMNPRAFVVAFLPMVAVYAMAYLCWRHMRSLLLPNIPRAPPHSRSDTIIIIDVLGLHMLLPLDWVDSWENVHNFLLERFVNRQGADYVRSRAYAIMHTDEEARASIIEPSQWTQTVRAGMTLEMSIVVLQLTRLVQCPWCENVSSQALNEGWIQCAGCPREYWASNATPEETEDISPEKPSFNQPLPAVMHPPRDPPPTVSDAALSVPSPSSDDVPVPEQPVSPGLSSTQVEAETGVLAAESPATVDSQTMESKNARLKSEADMTSFKRITVKHRYVDVGEALPAEDVGFTDNLEWDNLQYEMDIGGLDRLENALSQAHRSLEPLPDGSPEKPSRLHNLGAILLCRFEHLGELGDAEAAILSCRRAVELTPAESVEIPKRLHSLGVCLQHRFECTGELDDLEEAITILRRAIDLTKDDNGNLDKRQRLNDLGVSLQRRYERVGNSETLESAILSLRRALELTPDEHHDFPRRLNNLGIALRRRYERTGDLHNLESAITDHQRAVALTPDGNSDKPSRLSGLSIALRRRFERHGDLDDLERAIAAIHNAVELTRDNHPDKPSRLSGLGTSLRRRYERLEELDDIERAIDAGRHAVELTPDGHPDKPSRLGSLGLSLQCRFERLKKPDDLEHAISVLRVAIELTPEDHPNRPRQLMDISGALLGRYEHFGMLEDLESAILAVHRSIELVPDTHPDKPGYRSHLGVCLRQRFQQIGERNDLDSSVSVLRAAVELTPDGHSAKCGRLSHLGWSLQLLFEVEPSKSHFDTAISSFLAAAEQSSANPSHRLQSAMKCLSLISAGTDFGSSEYVLLAHSLVMDVLPQLVWLGHHIERRFEQSAGLGSLVHSAVSAAISTGALPQAVEWFEAGLSLVWSQIETLRAPLNDLHDHYPQLADALSRVSQELGRTVHKSFFSDSTVAASYMTRDHKADRHRQLAIEYERLLAIVRSSPGFEDFLRRRQFKTLSAGVQHSGGPVVLVNVDSSRCDALVLYPSGTLTLVALPELSLERAQKLRSLWISYLHRMSGLGARGLVIMEHDGDDTYTSLLLRKLWTSVVHPILLSIDLAAMTAHDVLPHITWCPSGPLMQLPLHAAGIYGETMGPRAFDFVVSSYVPSLSALLRSSEGVAKQNPGVPSMLIVTQPETPGLAHLPHTIREGQSIRHILSESSISCTILDHKQATVDAVRSALDKHPWVHLACHGTQHPDDVTRNALALYDGLLYLSDLMEMVADDAELAFLSGCQTALGDDKIAEESAHLAAGMLMVGFKGVIATLWAINDNDAPVVAEAYYKKLLELREADILGKGQTGAAYALHEAARVLREKVGERSFSRWVPFVHIGV